MKHLEKQIESAIPLLKEYVSLIFKWQKAINLVSNKELSDLWMRHILDSAQLFFLIPSSAHSLLDMGSGGGFPGIIISILNLVLNGPLKEITLVESNSKKCIFLQEVARKLSLNVNIVNERLEYMIDKKVDVVTSRALARTGDLLSLGYRFKKEKTLFLFLKGINVSEELTQLPFLCNIQKIPSQINSQGCILKITEVK